jgi:hypothetical protein
MTGNHCILLLSDVHADIAALEAILRVSGSDAFRDRFGAPGRVVNLGDAVERGYSPCEVIDRMKAIRNLASVRGNHDEAFVWNNPVSGSDSVSLAAHEECRERGSWMDFFSGMEAFAMDREERLYFVHGGPVNPDRICPPGADLTESWLCSQTWQRISRTGERYLDNSGYHYLPGDAFDEVRAALGAGFAVLCGHEHAEAVYREKDGRVEDILFGLDISYFEAGSRKVEEKRIALEDGANYLVRLGIAGPSGYYHLCGWDRCYFGVYRRDAERRYISLLSFALGRDTIPPK